MRDAVGRLSPNISGVVSYHLGWTEADGTPSPARGGKGIRAALAVLSAEATWAGAEVGAPGGVAIELVHNFSLVHDDLMDGDIERRHRPTVWALSGPCVALLVGDALATLATDVLLRSPNAAGAAAAAALGEATAEMIAGQADDLAFEKRRSVSVEECMAMSTAKTGALLGCAASIGAVLADAPPATVYALRDFGRHLGVAFQAVDDLLGIWGDPRTTGKPAGNDIRQRKKSMPIVAALAAGDDGARELESLLFDTRPGSAISGPAISGEVVPGGIILGEAIPDGREPRAGHHNGAMLMADQVDGGHPRLVTGTAAVPEPGGPGSGDVAGGGVRWPGMDGRPGQGPPRRRPRLARTARLSAVPRRALADLAVYAVERES